MAIAPAWEHLRLEIRIFMRFTTDASTSLDPRNAKRFSKPLQRSIWKFPRHPKSPPTAEMIKRGQELIAKAVEAFGAGSKLDQLRSFQRTDLRGNQVKNILMLAFPDALRQETVRPNFTLTPSSRLPNHSSIVNNTARPMPEGNRAAIYKELNHELLVLLRARTRSDFKASAAGADSVEKSLAYVDVELPGSLQPWELIPQQAA